MSKIDDSLAANCVKKAADAADYTDVLNHQRNPRDPRLCVLIQFDFALLFFPHDLQRYFAARGAHLAAEVCRSTHIPAVDRGDHIASLQSSLFCCGASLNGTYQDTVISEDAKEVPQLIGELFNTDARLNECRAHFHTWHAETSLIRSVYEHMHIGQVELEIAQSLREPCRICCHLHC